MQRLMCRMVVCVLIMLLLVSGCDVGLGPCAPARTGDIELHQPETRPVSRAQTPVSPVGAPGQTPTAPYHAQSPESPNGRPEADVASALELSLAKVKQLEAGMSYDDVYGILGEPGILIAGTDTTNTVYRWSYAGMSFMGRFEDGVLRRKSIVYPEDEGGRVVLDEQQLEFDQQLFDAIAPGMKYEEVMALIGMEPQPLTTGDGAVSIYKWNDIRGSSIIGRFEGDVLARKTGTIQSPEIPWESQQETPDADEEEAAWDDSITPGGVPYTTERLRQEHSAPFESDASHEEEEIQTQPQSRVHVAGVTRRDREMSQDPSPHAGRSYRPVVRLPSSTRSLRSGVFEIRIRNRAETRIEAALLSDAGGREVTIVPGGTVSLFVNRGAYDLYYIYTDDPYTLYQSEQIPVSDTLTDFVVDIYEDSYTINFLDRIANPGNAPRR